MSGDIETTLTPIRAHEGLLAHMIGQSRPDLLPYIEETGRIETAVIGLGGQGTRHAGMMKQFGSLVVGGVAPGRGGERIHETIPVYDSVSALLGAHPHLAAVSIWRHFSSARDAALEAIEAGVPVIVLISEGIPLRDVRDVLAAAREKGVLLLGGNTPGAIFPPERIKVGMLPDVFHPAEPEPNKSGGRGVTILSRSGAILYHMSDALASAGIAQNAVIGVGGDGAIGSTFRDLVPLVMSHESTDLVVVAGEIGGSQEELFAEEVKADPDRYPKKILALISGRHAPAGKTMGHAGAIVAPGQEYGTYKSKRAALEDAGITVVNSQYDLIERAREMLGGKTYFEAPRYYERMRRTWEVLPAPPSWGTMITRVEPNDLAVAGYPLTELVREKSLVEMVGLLTTLELPSGELRAALAAEADAAVRAPAPAAEYRSGEQLSATLARLLLVDDALEQIDASTAEGRALAAARAVGRAVRYVSAAMGTQADLDSVPGGAPFGELLARAVGGGSNTTPERTRLIEALAVASVDHGVTPPSAQATVLAGTVRAPFPMALASGVGAITDVHGGAGEDAAEFFLSVARQAAELDLPLEDVALDMLDRASRSGHRTPGMGHRVHTEDPRRNVLWDLADEAGTAGACVSISRMMEEIFPEVRGFSLPINVDGVIGAITADLLLRPLAAKALFVLGRVAGLSAHYFEEVLTQSPMRRIRFDEAVYRGPEARSLGDSQGE